MSRYKFLWGTMLIALVSVSLFPIYTIVYLEPYLTELLTQDTKDEAVRIANFFSTFVASESQELKKETLPKELLTRLGYFRGDGHLTKMKIYAPSGEVLYSTEADEVGQVNQEQYFRQIEATRTGRTEIVPENSRTLENEVVASDVIETYVPILRQGRLIGVFELYHNVSKERKDLNRLFHRSYGTLFVMALCLMFLVLLSSVQTHRGLKEREKTEERLRLLSLTDDLTGLYNRRGFLALAEQQTRVAMRDRKPMLVVSADLDGLKAINDTFGHKEGDAAIVETAHVLRECFRKSDLIARLGGDEFAVLLTGGEAEFDRDQLSSRLQAIVDRHNEVNDWPYRISVSAGFAYFDAAGRHTFEDLLHEADKMMYEQKRQRKEAAA